MRRLCALIVYIALQGCGAGGTPNPIFDGQPKLSVAHATVIDGDTLEMVLLDQPGKAITVDLWGIDAPELPQYFGLQAKQAIERRVYNQKLLLIPARLQDKGSLSGKLFADGDGIAEILLEKGLAWAAPRHTSSHYRRLEFNARDRRAGLWLQRFQIPPWEYLASRGEKPNAKPAPKRLIVKSKHKAFENNNTLGCRIGQARMGLAISAYSACLEMGTCTTEALVAQAVVGRYGYCN